MKRLLFFLLPIIVSAQEPAVLPTAYPSLRIATAARGLGMGDLGIAGATDNQALYYNMAKTAFTRNLHQASVSYLPWLQAISADTRLLHMDYLGSVRSSSAVGVAVTWLDLGTLSVRDANGATLALYKASEYNLTGSYALQLGAQHGLGASFRVMGQQVFTTIPHTSYAVSGDIGYYGFAALGDASHKLEWGAVLTGLGPKVSLPGTVGSTALPTTAGIGLHYTVVPTEEVQWSAGIDATRLLADEMKGTRLSAGVEFQFASQFSLRSGISYESKWKGNRRYCSFGAGYKGFVSDQAWGLDFYYLVPYSVTTAVSPFQHSFGFTLYLNFGNFQ